MASDEARVDVSLVVGGNAASPRVVPGWPRRSGTGVVRRRLSPNSLCWNRRFLRVDAIFASSIGKYARSEMLDDVFTGYI